MLAENVDTSISSTVEDEFLGFVSGWLVESAGPAFFAYCKFLQEELQTKMARLQEVSGSAERLQQVLHSALLACNWKSAASLLTYFDDFFPSPEVINLPKLVRPTFSQL